MGLDFHVNSKVLIPRPDTEILVETILERMEAGSKVLDLGTGSGAIAISLDLLGKDLDVTAVDLSEEALAVARDNNEKLGGAVQLLHGDLLSPVGACVYDCIVSNPPYISDQAYALLEENVKAYEPVMALHAEEEGLFFYRKIVENAAEYLSARGYLAFEIGYDQAQAVVGMMRREGYDEIEVIQDLSGKDRVVIGRKGEKNV
jgi:release factor glutamine methyltransferase